MPTIDDEMDPFNEWGMAPAPPAFNPSLFSPVTVASPPAGAMELLAAQVPAEVLHLATLAQAQQAQAQTGGLAALFDSMDKNQRAVRKKSTVSDTSMVLQAKEGFKFGCDPELFVKNEKGVYVTAEGLIPGTKDSPFKVDRGAVQVDGMAAEFNIDPAESFDQWNDNISTVLEQLLRMLPEGYTLSAVPSVVFSEEEFDKAPDCAKELGCSPDFNAWTGEVNPPPYDPSNPFLRTASGHIHIGWTEDQDLGDMQHVMNCRDLVKQLDWFLGGWSVLHDTDSTRRKMYGRAGACRYKPYGVEYRVLSNFWIMERETRLAVWNRLQTAINDMKHLVMAESSPSVFNTKLVESINLSQIDTTLEKTFKYPLRNLDRSVSAL